MARFRYLLAAGHVPGGGAERNGFEEGAEAARFVDELARALRALDVPCLVCPHALDLVETIGWVNERRRAGDRPLEVHFNAASDPAARGAMVAVTASSRTWGARLLYGLELGGVPRWGRGVYDESEVASWRGWRHLGFPHQTEGVLVELGFVTSPRDVELFRSAKARAAVVEAIAAELAQGQPPRLFRYTVRAPRAVVRAAKAAVRRARERLRPAE